MNVPIPAQHCPHNSPHHHWAIRYCPPDGGPVEVLYVGPDKDDATREIARLEAEGNRVIPPAASWSDPDAPRCAWCEFPFGEDREGGEVEFYGTGHPARGHDKTYVLRRAKHPRGPGMNGLVMTRLEICQLCTSELGGNRENEIRRLQDGGLSRKDAEAIHEGDAEALSRAMEKRGVSAMRPLRLNYAMSEKASNLYREAAIAGILGDEGEVESKRNDARAEELHLDRQDAIGRIQRRMACEREGAEEVVDEILMKMSIRCSWEEGEVQDAQERKELAWSVTGIVLVAVAIGLGIFYWPDWLNSTVSLVRQCLGSAP